MPRCQRYISTMSNDALQLDGGEEAADTHSQDASEGRFRFDMIQRGDFIKPGWWHWRCRREDDTGDVAYGYVQADPLGNAVVAETFESDRR